MPARLHPIISLCLVLLAALAASAPAAAAAPPGLAPGTFGTFALKFGSSGSASNQFQSPFGLATDAQGNVYVADVNNNKLKKWSGDGTFLEAIQTSATSASASPFGVTVDRASGARWVVNGSPNQVQKINADGTFGVTFGSLGTGDGQLDRAYGIALDRTGNVYVSDTFHDRIQKFDASGTFVAKWGGTGTGNTQFNRPRQLAIDSAGNIYVADSANHRVQKFDSSGTYLATWGTTGTASAAAGQFNTPHAIAVDAADNVYVTERGNSRVQKFTSAGVLVGSWGSRGSGDGQFGTALGIAVDPSGNIFLGEALGFGGLQERVQKFTSSALSYVEGAAPLVVDPLVDVADPDGGNLAGATVQITDGFRPGQDVLGFSDQNGIAGAVSGSTLTLSGSASVADYETALRSVTFASGEDPGGATRTIAFQVSDATDPSNAVARRIAVTATNDAPAAVADARSTDEDSVLTVAAPGVLANDLDPDSTLAVDQVGGSAANVGQVLTTAKGAKLRIGADGALSYDPDGAFESLGTGESDTETVTYRATDGVASPSAATLTITVDGVDDAPLLATTSTTLAYTEADPPAAVDPGLTVADADDADLASAIVTLTAPQPGDRLGYATTNGVSGVVGAAGDTVTLTGAHTKADYQAALRAVTFENTTKDPGSAARSVTFAAGDGEKTSAPASRQIAVTPVDDPPAPAPTPTPTPTPQGDQAPPADPAPPAEPGPSPGPSPGPASPITPPVAPKPPAIAVATIARGDLTLDRAGRTKLRFTCSGGLACSGTLTIRTVSKGKVTLVRRSFAKAPAGRTTTLTIALTKKGRAMVTRLRRVKVLVELAVTNPRPPSPRRASRTLVIKTR
jgi:VCBS repeat-containing protein